MIQIRMMVMMVMMMIIIIIIMISISPISLETMPSGLLGLPAGDWSEA